MNNTLKKKKTQRSHEPNYDNYKSFSEYFLAIAMNRLNTFINKLVYLVLLILRNCKIVMFGMIT